MSAGSHRFEYLDSMRGLAAMSVVWSHFVLSYQWPNSVQPILMNSPLHLFWDGAAAVSFFFVLSGFVLSLGQFKSVPARKSLFNFYSNYFIARTCRIWLPYAFWVAVSLVLKLFFFHQTNTDPASSEWLLSFWHNHTLFKHFILEMNLYVKPTLFTLLPHGWSLFTEMVISLFIPLGILMAMRSMSLLVVLVLILVSALDSSVYLYHFLMGLILARLFPVYGEKWKRAPRAIKGAMLILGLTLYGARFFLNLKELDLISGIGAAVIIWTALSSPLMQDFLSLSFFKFLGKISYSIYLCHFAILLCLTPWMIHGLNLLGITHWAVVGMMGLAFTTIITIGLSSVLFQKIEMPSMKLGKKLYR